MSDNYKQDLLLGAFFGGTIATLATLLFTTKKGKQLRDKVGDFCEDVGENVTEALSDAKEDVEKTAEHAAKKIHHKTKSDHHHKDDPH